MDMAQYRELFVSEAKSHLEQINELVMRLEHAPGDQEAIAALFRGTHSLKGMASTMSFAAFTALAHSMEDLLDRLRSGGLRFEGGIADLLLAGADVMVAMVEDVAAGRSPEREVGALTAQLAAYRAPDVVAVRLPPATAAGSGETGPEPSPGGSSIRIRTQLLDRLIDMSGELLTVRHRFAMLAEQLAMPELSETVSQLSLLLRKLHGEVLTIRMLPFATITDRFPRLVRDLARHCGKELDFLVDGQGLELDRSIIEQLAEPLAHLLRNAVDHGLEPPAERLAAGKPEVGRLRLSVVRDYDHVVVTVADDGRGMEPARLIATAVAKGLISAAQGNALTPNEAYQLICLPGFSTAAAVTEVSGRGVGMDAVRATVQTLGGSLTIESTAGQGSRMILRLPLSVAIIAVVLVQAGPFTFALPARNLLRTLDLGREQILLRDKKPFAQLPGEEIPLQSLNRLFGLPLPTPAPATVPLFVAEVQGRKSGFVVERFLGQQDIFVKPLGQPLAALAGLAGGAVLGDGTVVFVLDVPRLRDMTPEKMVASHG